MKKPIFAIAIIFALLACSVPVTSYAADVQILDEGDGYVVIGGQGIESLQHTLKNIFSALGNGNIACPDIPGNSEPEVPEQPDTQAPITPEQPDTQEPTIPEQPDTQEPTVPEQPDTQEPDSEDSEETVHPYAIQVLNLVNKEREKAGLPALKLDANITAAANVRAKEITQSFSHTRPNGSSFSTALKEQGVSFRGSGENIAWGQRSAVQVMDSWMNSDGHRANILNANFKNLGVGYYQDENGRNHWVQLFTY